MKLAIKLWSHSVDTLQCFSLLIAHLSLVHTLVLWVSILHCDWCLLDTWITFYCCSWVRVIISHHHSFLVFTITTNDVMPQLIGASSFSVVKMADEHWPLNLLYEAILWLLIKFSILLDTPPNSCYGCEVVATVVPSVSDEFCAAPFIPSAVTDDT